MILTDNQKDIAMQFKQNKKQTNNKQKTCTTLTFVFVIRNYYYYEQYILNLNFND